MIGDDKDLKEKTEKLLEWLGTDEAKRMLNQPSPSFMPTDTAILDWMQHEGLESILRVPQFSREGASLGISLWVSHWMPGQSFVSLRGAAVAGMEASKT